MGEDLLMALSMENHHRSTLLSMDPSGLDCELMVQRKQMAVSVAPDINVPLSFERSPPPQSWHSEPFDMLDVRLGPQMHETEAILHLPKVGATRKSVKRGESIWGAWFFFTFYFKPVLSEKSKGMITRGANGFDKSDLRLDVFMVQHDMENMYMWVFKERPENALGKMQLRSYMNGHSRLGEPQFPFSVDRGFVRSHRMQRKQYRGLSNPQCVHGIEIIRSPNLSEVCEVDRRKWMELTGRDLNFSIPLEASDFGSWRSLPSMEFELERLPVKSNSHSQPKKLVNGSNLNLSSLSNDTDAMDLSPMCNKRKKDLFPHGMEEDSCFPKNSYPERGQDGEMPWVEPSWMHEFTGVMRHAHGPVTAAKTIYEDEEGYLIMVSLPLSDQQRVKVSSRNTINHGIVKIVCVSNARMPYIKRHDRTFKLTDPCPEHCPPGEFIREITLPTRIPKDAKLEAYYDETGARMEIMVPKLRIESEEHEVHICMRPHLGVNDLMLT